MPSTQNRRGNRKRGSARRESNHVSPKRGTHTGRVKWFNGAKGYGFIVRDDDGTDIFVHYTDIAKGGFRKLDEGERVTFDIGQGQKGLQAQSVANLSDIKD